MPIVKIEFLDILGTLWLGEEEHPYIVFEASATKNGRSVLLVAHCSTQTEEYCVQEVTNRFAEIVETPLSAIMHQNNRKSKKMTKKLSKLYKDGFVVAIVLELDRGVDNPLAWEVDEEDAQEARELPYFIVE
jgi:hypothetical protein